MRKLTRQLIIFSLITILLIGCTNQKQDVQVKQSSSNETVDETQTSANRSEYESSIKEEVNQIDTISKPSLEEIDFSSFTQTPNEWGENVSGVKQRFKTDKKEMALTFDACGGKYGSEFDERLIEFLQQEEIATTLFINERWINENKELFIQLAENPLFQIENHGTDHKPLSVSGGEAWGIPATTSPEEVYAEIMNNHETVKELTGINMKLFRSGTAFYDEIAVQLANELGYTIVNFDILGDAGATYSSEQVKNALLQAQPGSIALLHMNQPGSGTASGVISAIPLLQKQGFQFVHLSDVAFE